MGPPMAAGRPSRPGLTDTSDLTLTAWRFPDSWRSGPRTVPCRVPALRTEQARTPAPEHTLIVLRKLGP